MKHARDLIGQAYFDAAGRAFGACAHRLQDDGVDLAGYSLPERVDDLEAARLALGYRRIDLLSESAGTRTAHDLRLAPPDEHPPLGDGRRQPARATSSGTPRRRTSRSASTPRSAHATSRAARGRATSPPPSRRPASNIPDRWGFLGSSRATRRIGVVLRPDALDRRRPRRSPRRRTIDTWLAASKGDASGLWFLSTLGQLAFPDVQVKGDTAAVARTDARYARRYFASERGRRLDPAAAPAPTSSGPAAGCSTLARQSRRERVRPGAGLEGRDAADRREPRLRDAAADRHARAAAPPAERPPGRPAGPRPHRRLLGLRAAGELASRSTRTSTRGVVDDSLYTGEPRRLRRPGSRRRAIAKIIARA